MEIIITLCCTKRELFKLLPWCNDICNKTCQKPFAWKVRKLTERFILFFCSLTLLFVSYRLCLVVT